ncbi:hypothetical protein ACYOEI_14795, partial [Singulisphaera rosea]
LRFALGLFRGGRHGLAEPMLENAGPEAPTKPVERVFSVPAKGVDDVRRLEEVVDRTFQATIEEEYDPRSARNYDREGMRKLKTPRPFKPDYAPKAMDDAIRSHLGEIPDILSESPMHARARLKKPRPAAAGEDDRGFARRVNENGTGRGGPG